MKNETEYLLLVDINSKISKMVAFKNLQKEVFFVRLSQEFPDGLNRYIIRVGDKKVILEVSKDDIKYIMEL